MGRACAGGAGAVITCPASAQPHRRQRGSARAATGSQGAGRSEEPLLMAARTRGECFAFDGARLIEPSSPALLLAAGATPLDGERIAPAPLQACGSAPRGLCPPCSPPPGRVGHCLLFASRGSIVSLQKTRRGAGGGSYHERVLRDIFTETFHLPRGGSTWAVSGVGSWACGFE